MTTVYCVFRTVKTDEGEEVGLLVSIHESQAEAMRETNRLNSGQKAYHYHTFWNVQP